MEGVLVEQSRMRAGIARRMVESKRRAPHFYVQTEVAVDTTQERLAELNKRGGTKVTMTVALIRACALTLSEHPGFNSVWTKDGLLQAADVNVGVAIALPDGLVAPALLNTNRLSVPELSEAFEDLVARARSRKLRPAELTDATFTLSNLGMFDIVGFTAIVTPPQVAILATARPVRRWVIENDRPRAVSLMTVTLSADHRAVDGVDAARFLETFKHVMEAPDTLLPEPAKVKEVGS